MSFLSAKCNHCHTEKIKLNVLSQYQDGTFYYFFLSCEGCKKPTMVRAQRSSEYVSNLRRDTRPIPFNVSEDIDLTKAFHNIRLINSLDSSDQIECPLHVPYDIKNCFDEAAKCFQVECYIACSAMFRLCLDLITKDLMKQTDSKDINKLYDRINYLIEKALIPSDLKDLAHNIRLDGNDAAHDGSTSKDEADDIIDFTVLLLERVYTNKEKLLLAQQRRQVRRAPSKNT